MLPLVGPCIARYDNAGGPRPQAVVLARMRQYNARAQGSRCVSADVPWSPLLAITVFQ